MSVEQMQLKGSGNFLAYTKEDGEWCPQRDKAITFDVNAFATKFPSSRVSYPAWGFDGEVYDAENNFLGVVTISLTREQALELGRMLSNV